MEFIANSSRYTINSQNYREMKTKQLSNKKQKYEVEEQNSKSTDCNDFKIQLVKYEAQFERI